MVHVPPLTSITVAVCELKLTASPELEVALTANGEFPKTWFAPRT
jgi:hypothetical protein